MKDEGTPNNRQGEVLEKNPDLNKLASQSHTASLEVALEQHRGPIPSPATLAAYKELDPALVTWILDASSKEQNQRHEMEKAEVAAAIAERKRGQNYALGAVALTMLSCCWVAYVGYGWPAGLLGSTGIGAIVYTFVHGSRPSSDSDSAD